ncbi:MAG: hypothetical protein U0T69_11135 [Chitinophagales bacterium]
MANDRDMQLDDGFEDVTDVALDSGFEEVEVKKKDTTQSSGQQSSTTTKNTSQSNLNLGLQLPTVTPNPNNIALPGLGQPFKKPISIKSTADEQKLINAKQKPVIFEDYNTIIKQGVQGQNKFDNTTQPLTKTVTEQQAKKDVQQLQQRQQTVKEAKKDKHQNILAVIPELADAKNTDEAINTILKSDQRNSIDMWQQFDDETLLNNNETELNDFLVNKGLKNQERETYLKEQAASNPKYEYDYQYNQIGSLYKAVKQRADDYDMVLQQKFGGDYMDIAKQNDPQILQDEDFNKYVALREKQNQLSIKANGLINDDKFKEVKKYRDDAQAAQDKIDQKAKDDKWYKFGDELSYVDSKLAYARGHLVKMIAELPALATSIDKGYDWTDKLADWGNRYSDMLIDSTPTSTDLKTGVFNKIADVDGYKVFLDDNGDATDVRDKNNFKVSAAISQPILEKYSENPENYKVIKDRNFWAAADNGLNTVIDMGEMILGTKGAGYIGAGEKAQKLASMGIAYQQTKRDVFNDAIKKGLDPRNADLLSNIIGVTAGASSALNPLEYNIASGKGLFNFLKTEGLDAGKLALIKEGKLTVKDYAKEFVKGAIKNSIGENIEELGIENTTQAVANNVFNNAINETDKVDGGLDDKLHILDKQGLETALITAGAAFLMTPVEIRSQTQLNQQEALKMAIENPEDFARIKQLQLERGHITQEQLDAETKIYDEVSKSYNAVKGDIDEKLQPQLLALLAKKYNLQNKVNEISDDALSKPYKEQIKAINAGIESIAGGQAADANIAYAADTNIAYNESIDEIKRNKELDNKEIDDKIANIDKNIPQWQQDQQKEKLEKQRTEQNDYYESKIKLLGQATAAESASTIAKVETDIANKISRGEDLSAEETDYYNAKKEDIDKLVSSETYKSSTDNEKSSIENAITGQVEDNSIGVQRNQSNGGAVEQRNATENVKENTQESQQQKGQPQLDLQKEIDDKKQIISELEANPNSPFHKLVDLDQVKKEVADLEGKLSSSLSQQNDKLESPVGAQTSTEVNNKVDESNTQTETSTIEDKSKDVLSEKEKQDIVKSLDKNEIKQFLKLKTPQERTQFLTDKKNSEYSKKYDASESEAEALTRITTGIKDLPASEQQAEIKKRANDHAAEYQKYLDKNPISEETKKLPRVAKFAQQTAKAMRNIIDNPEKWQSKTGKSFENGSRIDENGDVIPEQMYIDLKEKVKSLRKQNKLEEIAKINEAPRQYYADNIKINSQKNTKLDNNEQSGKTTTEKQPPKNTERESVVQQDNSSGKNEVSNGIQESRSDANKFKSIPKESFDKLINTLSKAFPNIKIFSDEKLLAEKLKKYNSSVDLKTPNGTIYGAKFPDGTIYINTENLNANTPIHEFGHVWEKAFPEDFERGKLMLRNSEQGRKLIEETRLNPAYKGYSQSQIESEALVAAIGNKGEQIFNSNPKLLEKFQTWLNDLFAKISDRIGKITGIKSLEFSPDTTFENFTKQVAGQLLSGKQLDASVKNSDKTELQFSPDELKSQVDALRKEDFTDNEIRDYLLEAGNTNEQIDQVLGKEVFGIKKATVPQDVIDEISIDKKSHKQIYEAGKDNVQSGAVDPRQLVQDVLSGDTLVLDANQVAALIYYRAQIDNKLKASTEKLKNEDGDYYQLKANHDVLLQELADYHEMAVRTAYNQSVAFSMRKMLIDNEYNAQAQIAKYKAVNNGNISVEKEQEFIKLADDYKAAADKIAELENKLSEYEAQQALNIIIEDKKKISPARTQRKQKAKNLIAEGLDELAEALGTRLMAEGNERPKLTKALTKIGKGLIETGVASIEDVYDKIIEKVKEKFGDKVNVEIYKNDVIADLKNIYTKATVKNDELNISNVLIKNLVQNGYNTVESLTKKLKEIISETTQDVTDRQIHDAITKYGKTTNQSKEEIDQQITKLKRIMLLTSKIEDARNKNRPKKTGFIRDEASPEEREMQKQLNELLKDIPLDSVDTEKLFKTALEKVKKRLQNQIEDLEQQIKTGKKEAQKKGIEYDEEANNLVKRRDELKKKLEEIYGATGTSYEQRVKTALRTVKAAISEYERRIQESDFKRKEQNKLTPTSELQQEKDALKKLKDQYLEMRKDSDEAENERIDRFKKSLNRTIEQYKRRIREKDFAPKTRKENPYDEEIGKLKQEQAKIKFQFEKEQELNKLENRSTSEKIKDVILGILNIPRILKTTIDLSAPFRQGIRLMAGHPIEFTRAFFKMHKLAFSKNAYDKFIADFISSDAYNVIKASGLSITDATGAQKAREEQFWNNIISNTLENKTLNKFTLGIPKFLDNYTFKASERGYSGFIDMMRINVFLDAMKVMERQGITFENNKQAYKELAAYVNAATGRGDTGRMGQRTMEVLNSVFFSPKFIKSMYDYVRSVAKATTGIGSELPAPVRKMIVKDFVAFVGTTTLLTALAQAAVKGLGDDEKDLETDGRSSDFMKIVAGKTRYEFWSGYQPMVRTIWQYITGESKSINSGEIKKVDGSIFGGRDRNDLIVDFFGNKLSPNASFIYKFNKGKDGAGNEFDAGKELKDMFIPMSINLFAEEIGNDEKLSKIVIDNFLNFYGVSVQNFYNDIKKDNTSSGNNKSEEKPESKKNRNKR